MTVLSVKKAIHLVVFAVIAAGMLLCCASCADDNSEKLKKSMEENPEIMFIISDDTPNCSMIISDEIYSVLKKDDYSYILDMMNDYFNVVINDEIDPNVVYIKAVSEKIDAEVRLAEIYDPSSKLSVLVQVAEAGKSVFPEYKDNSRFNMDEVSSSVEDSDDPKTQMLAELKSSLKKIADKGSICSVRAMKAEFKEKTKQIYSGSKDILKGNQLHYSDYYIDIDEENGLSIICGSEEAVLDALNYFLTEYLQMGISNEGDYMINIPDSKFHVGHYLKDTIAGKSIENYKIIYYCDKTYYDSRENAKYLKQYFLKNFGADLIMADINVSDPDLIDVLNNKIIIGKTQFPISEKYYSEKRDIMEYQILHQGDDLYIMGGSDWAIKYAIDYLINEFFSKEIPLPYAYNIEGSMYGEYVFHTYRDANLRIMSNNVMDMGYNSWYILGEDSSNHYRFKEMAKAYIAYNPDVLSFQELNPRPYFSNFMLQEINNGGRNYQYVDGAYTFYIPRNYTPMIYNTDTLNLIESGAHTFTYGSNSGTKSYTWGCFENKKTGFRFIAFSTHLWWKKETVYAGSSDMRAEQMKEICDMADLLIKKYACPCFVMGDFNCNSTQKEYATMAKNDFSDCHEIATEYANNSSGRYVCNPTSFSYKSNVGTYKKNSIDHILVKNLKKARVLSYNYAVPNFYGKLSDHAPVYIDVKIRS